MTNIQSEKNDSPRDAEGEQNQTHFGYRQVSTREKTKLVGDVFDSVATRYDLMNDIMSFGLHRYWKHRVIDKLDVKHTPNLSILDLAGGTGDLSALLFTKAALGVKIVLTDINYNMVRVGRKRKINQGYNDVFSYVIANAEKLSFPDSSFDRVIIGFGLRNVTHKQQALNDMFRVLRPGGRMLVLEFSEVKNKKLAQIYDWYSFSVLPLLGRVFVNDSQSYQYLAESIRHHPPQQELLSMIEQSGFIEAQYENFLQGIVAVHTAIKPIY